MNKTQRKLKKRLFKIMEHKGEIIRLDYKTLRRNRSKAVKIIRYNDGLKLDYFTRHGVCVLQEDCEDGNMLCKIDKNIPKSMADAITHARIIADYLNVDNKFEVFYRKDCVLEDERCSYGHMYILDKQTVAIIIDMAYGEFIEEEVEEIIENFANYGKDFIRIELYGNYSKKFNVKNRDLRHLKTIMTEV